MSAARSIVRSRHRSSSPVGLACGRRHDLAGASRQLVDERELAELQHQRPEVAGVEELHPQVRVELEDAAELAVLLADELLAERRHLEVEVEVRQPEVRREALDDAPSRFQTIGNVCGSYSQRTW
jgi:hypothetical protein